MDTTILAGQIKSIALQREFEVVWQFFIIFSLFEYALKRDKRYIHEKYGRAEANWDKYASENNKSFSENKSNELQSAIIYFNHTPPRKQLYKNSKVAWSEPLNNVSSEPCLIWLLKIIRTVRNNLFHGGKYPGINVPEPSRDSELLEHSITILIVALKLDTNVEREFNHGLKEFLNN